MSARSGLLLNGLLFFHIFFYAADAAIDMLLRVYGHGNMSRFPHFCLKKENDENYGIHYNNINFVHNSLICIVIKSTHSLVLMEQIISVANAN